MEWRDYMDSRKLKELEHKYLNGECTPEELHLLENWMANLPNYEDVTLLDPKSEQALEKTVWNNLQQKLGLPDKVPAVNGYKSKRLLYFKASAIAATVALIIISSVVVYWYYIPQPITEGAWLTVTTTKGSTEKITLPDSSTVWLNAATTLRYPTTFTTERKIVLEEGEAFFAVRRDPARPFIVIAAQVQTEVLGTSFSVKAYRSLSEVKVKVASGKVRVRDDHRIIGQIAPQEQLTYRLATGHFQKESVTTDEIMSWRSHRLIFYRASFQEIALAIENRYGVKIDYNPGDVSDLQLTLKASSDWTLAQVLETLAIVSHTHYSFINDKRVKIN